MLGHARLQSCRDGVPREHRARRQRMLPLVRRLSPRYARIQAQRCAHRQIRPGLEAHFQSPEQGGEQLALRYDHTVSTCPISSVRLLHLASCPFRSCSSVCSFARRPLRMPCFASLRGCSVFPLISRYLARSLSASEDCDACYILFCLRDASCCSAPSETPPRVRITLHRARSPQSPPPSAVLRVRLLCFVLVFHAVELSQLCPIPSHHIP